MITVRLGARDINNVLAAAPESASGPDPDIVFRNGHFEMTVRLGPMKVVARAYPDLRDGLVRIAVPFSDIREERLFGGLLGGALSLGSRFFEDKLDEIVADRLARHGLPWEMAWVDHFNDPKRGRVATINVSPRTLNRWLLDKTPPGQMAPRLGAITIGDDYVQLKVDLVVCPAGVPQAGSGDAPDQPAPGDTPDPAVPDTGAERVSFGAPAAPAGEPWPTAGAEADSQEGEPYAGGTG